MLTACAAKNHPVSETATLPRPSAGGEALLPNRIGEEKRGGKRKGEKRNLFHGIREGNA